MVDKPIDISSLPPQLPPKPQETEKSAAAAAKKASFDNPFPQMHFAGEGIDQKEFVKKFWEGLERSMSDTINHQMQRMKEANEKLRKSMEGGE